MQLLQLQQKRVAAAAGDAAAASTQSIHTYIYIYIFIFICLIFLCLVVCSEPRYVEEPYPASPEKLEDFISVNWVLDAVPEGAAAPPELSAADRMALQLLSYLLLGTSSSPLYKALSESGLGKSVIGGGLGLDLRHATFSVGLKGK